MNQIPKKRGRPPKHDPTLSNYQKHKKYYRKYNRIYQRLYRLKNKFNILSDKTKKTQILDPTNPVKQGA